MRRVAIFTAVAVPFCCCAVGEAWSAGERRAGSGRAESAGVDEPADLTATELVQEARAAFDVQDFGRAERLLDQLVAEYGDNPDVAKLVDGSRPMLAMCRVKRGEFGEALELIDRSLGGADLVPAAREELQFWRGICLLREGEIDAAQRQFGEYFRNESHDRTRRYEAFLLYAGGFLQRGDAQGAADFLTERIPKLPPDMAEVAGRARVLLLHSLTAAGRRDAALALVRETFPRLRELTQVAAFQLLTLQLGAEFLEEGRWHEAIACLHRLWPRDRLIAHQRQRLQEWEERRERLRREGARREAVVYQIDGVLARVRRELEQFEEMADYDASVQLRLAQAFIGLDRWREAGAILDRAVDSLPASQVVAQAALTALQCWQQVPRWDRALAAADRCLTKCFPDASAPERAEVLLARADALRGLRRLEEAERAFGDFANGNPKHKLAPRALFMGGICQIELDRSAAAVATFQLLRERYPKSPLAGDSLYWEGMALTFQRSWAEAEEVLRKCDRAGRNSQWAADAAFECARCLHNRLRHDEAVREFRGFLKKHRDHPRRAEALLLLGESLMAVGKMKEGIAELRKVPPEEVRMYEEAQFRIGDALRKLDEPQEAFDHFAAFLAANPRSRRLAEAVLRQGRAAQDLGRADEARELYRATLERTGDDPEAQGVEDLLLATRRFYPGRDGTDSLLSQLDALHRKARETGRTTLAARALWARGHVLREAGNPDAARIAFLQLADLLDPAVHHPRLIADCADARRESGGLRIAKELYESLRKWHPRAIELERSSLGLGRIAAAEGDRESAMKWFLQCERESVAGTCAGEAMLERAALLQADARTEEAAGVFEAVVSNRLALPAQKARALLALGRIALQSGDAARAAILFERCYLSGAKHRETAAEARLLHGRALEAAGRSPEAAAVYRELLTRRELAPSPAAAEARQRLSRLENVIAP